MVISPNALKVPTGKWLGPQATYRFVTDRPWWYFHRCPVDGMSLLRLRLKIRDVWTDGDGIIHFIHCHWVGAQFGVWGNWCPACGYYEEENDTIYSTLLDYQE